MSGFKAQTPVSQLIRTGKGGGGVDERKTRDSFRKEKDLEEDRKLGLEPACVDVDTGRDINPHIPQFITQTPWYVPAEGPTLKHQRPHWERQQEQESGVHDWYHRGQKETSSKPVKFKPGSCENCGAMTHKKKDCFERPRKMGAKHTNEDIAADDYLQPNLRLTSWEAKRDRWNGYDNAAYSDVIKEHEKQEEVRKIIKDQKLKEEKAAADAAKEKAENSADEGEEKVGSQGEDGGADDEDLYAEHADMQTSVDMDSRTRITVRNLRIREDTAKYLYNLNENAPYYDPKSRSMRENPLAGVKGKEQQAAKFSGENFVRYSGEVVAANEAQVFAWSARCQGIDVHALAEPTKLEQLQKDFKEEKKDVKEETKQKLLEKYGGDEHLQAPPKELLLAQSEAYVEYSRKGQIIKGEERPLIKSRYEEDVYTKNHTSVFGSYWANGRWGFRCCHSFVRQSYCIGEQGYAVNDEMAALPTMTKKEAKEEPMEDKKEAVKEEVEEKKEAKEESSSSSSDSDSSSDSVDSEEEREKAKKKKAEEAEEEKRRSEREARKRDRRREKRKRRAEKMGGKRKRKRHNSSSSESAADSDSDSEKEKEEEDNAEDAKLQREVAKALKEEKKARREAKKNERDRKYNTTYDIKKPTELEVEAYKLTQVHAADPMAKFIEEKRNK